MHRTRMADEEGLAERTRDLLEVGGDIPDTGKFTAPEDGSRDGAPCTPIRERSARGTAEDKAACSVRCASVMFPSARPGVRAVPIQARRAMR